MGKAIQLILVYFGIQILAGLVSLIAVGLMYGLDIETTQSLILAPTLFLGCVGMAIYLYFSGEIPKEKNTWSPVSMSYLLLTIIIGLCCIVLVDFVTSWLHWLPNWMEDSFDQILSSGLGILSVAVIGPILEELLFRGAITRILLQKYNPTKAILLSALIFGIFHLNPAQIVGAFLIGLLLAWIYYRTRSLIPVILIHILNNSLSVGLEIPFPEAETLSQLMPSSVYYVLIPVAIAIFALCLSAMNRQTTPDRVP